LSASRLFRIFVRQIQTAMKKLPIGINFDAEKRAVGAWQAVEA
jgi:hypothetical protein